MRLLTSTVFKLILERPLRQCSSRRTEPHDDRRVHLCVSAKKQQILMSAVITRVHCSKRSTFNVQARILPGIGTFGTFLESTVSDHGYENNAQIWGSISQEEDGYSYNASRILHVIWHWKQSTR